MNASVHKAEAIGINLYYFQDIGGCLANLSKRCVGSGAVRIVPFLAGGCIRCSIPGRSLFR